LGRGSYLFLHDPLIKGLELSLKVLGAKVA
jgi:hypothetical protein